MASDSEGSMPGLIYEDTTSDDSELGDGSGDDSESEAEMPTATDGFSSRGGGSARSTKAAAPAKGFERHFRRL